MVKFIKRTTLSDEKKISNNLHIIQCPYGYWVFGREYVKPGNCIFFEYADDSEKMLRSSPITHVEIQEDKKEGVRNYKIVTRNSIYYFEEELKGGIECRNLD